MHDLEQSASEQDTLSGGWLGTYAYKGKVEAEPPVRFDATFAETDGSVTGTILDDDNFGEADVRGEHSGQGVRFSKVYRHEAPAVSYEGTLAEDGRTMQGTWQIDRIDYGVWDARRAWSNPGLLSEEETEDDQAKEAVDDWDKPRVREVVRLG